MYRASDMPTHAHASARRKPIVSVVEDDSAMRAALTDLLDSAGCQSHAFASSEEFMESDIASTSDVVITDIQLGKIDGLELLRRLRTALQIPVPVIVITALTNETLERHAVAEGCYAFLRKPFDPETLLRHVKAAIAST